MERKRDMTSLPRSVGCCVVTTRMKYATRCLLKFRHPFRDNVGVERGGTYCCDRSIIVVGRRQVTLFQRCRQAMMRCLDYLHVHEFRGTAIATPRLGRPTNESSHRCVPITVWYRGAIAWFARLHVLEIVWWAPVLVLSGEKVEWKGGLGAEAGLVCARQAPPATLTNQRVQAALLCTEHCFSVYVRARVCASGRLLHSVATSIQEHGGTWYGRNSIQHTFRVGQYDSSSLRSKWPTDFIIASLYRNEAEPLKASYLLTLGGTKRLKFRPFIRIGDPSVPIGYWSKV